MLKALALTLTVAIFLSAGFTLAPADSPAPQGLTRTETLTVENLTTIPFEPFTVQARATPKTDREDKPKT
ncbi:MAG: hypothetical protein ACREDX_03945 [Aestuariivirga sp.]